MAQRRYRQRVPQSLRRKTDWIGGTVGNLAEAVLTSGTSFIISSFDTRVGGGFPEPPFTIIRQRGFLSVANVAGTARVVPVGAYGTCVINGEAFDAGVGSIPTPWDESFDERWLYHTYFGTVAQGILVTDQVLASVYLTIDGKGMRKVESGDVIVNVIENGGVDELLFMSNQRMLVKLH